MKTMSPEDVITRMEATPGLLQENWCVPRETGKLLYLLARTTGARRICEIGTSIGYSTLWLAMAARDNQGYLETIEAFEARQQQAITHIEVAGLDGVVTFHGEDALTRLQTMQTQGAVVDFAFIDAAKGEYLAYCRLLETMMPSGALLIADNTRSHRVEMQDFLAAMADTPHFDTAELETPNGQLIARKR